MTLPHKTRAFRQRDRTKATHKSASACFEKQTDIEVITLGGLMMFSCRSLDQVSALRRVEPRYPLQVFDHQRTRQKKSKLPSRKRAPAGV